MAMFSSRDLGAFKKAERHKKRELKKQAKRDSKVDDPEEVDDGVASESNSYQSASEHVEEETKQPTQSFEYIDKIEEMYSTKVKAAQDEAADSDNEDLGDKAGSPTRSPSEEYRRS